MSINESNCEWKCSRKVVGRKYSFDFIHVELKNEVGGTCILKEVKEGQ